MGKSQNVGIKSAFTPIKYIGGLGQVWQVQNFMTQTQPDPLLKKNFVTQPNPPSPKNRPKPTGWVRSGRVWWVGGFSTRPFSLASFGKYLMLPKLQNTLYTLNMCGLCLGTNLLLRYNNGRGEGKETTKDFPIEDEQLSL